MQQVDFPPFWSDDFDMDLLKVFPHIIKILGDTTITPLWTVGRTTHGRLNHPTVWDDPCGSLALFFTHEPRLERDAHGWFRIKGFYVDNAPVVPCTWVEVLRDAWPHHYAVTVDDMVLWNSSDLQDAFMRIMYDLRGWQKADITADRKKALHSIARANEKLRVLMRRNPCK